MAINRQGRRWGLLPFRSWMTLNNLSIVRSINFLLWKYIPADIAGKVWVSGMIIYIKALYISSTWKKCKLLILLLCCYYIFVAHWRVIICYSSRKDSQAHLYSLPCELNFLIHDIWSININLFPFVNPWAVKWLIFIMNCYQALGMDVKQIIYSEVNLCHQLLRFTSFFYWKIHLAEFQMDWVSPVCLYPGTDLHSSLDSL